MEDQQQLEKNIIIDPAKSISPTQCVICATTRPETSFIYTSRTKLGTSLLVFIQKYIKPLSYTEELAKSITICKSCLTTINNLEDARTKLNNIGDESTESDSDGDWSKEAISNKEPSKNSVSNFEDVSRKRKQLVEEDISQNLERERDKAAGNSTHDCNICKRKYFRYSYGRDLVTENRSNTSLDCLICQHLFKFKACRRRKPLTDRKPVGCNICKCRFRQDLSLGSHLKHHTRQIPYQCHACEMKFYKKAHFTIHLVECQLCVCGIKCIQFSDVSDNIHLEMEELYYKMK